MPRFHNINGVDVQFTVDEEAARDAEEAYGASQEVPRAWAAIRTKRNNLISATDWRVLPDQPVSQPWLDYRQALRDVTNVATPDLVVWPTEPGV